MKNTKLQFSNKLTFLRYDYSSQFEEINQLAVDRHVIKPEGMYKFENILLGFVGEIVFKQFLDEANIQYEYNPENYTDHGDEGWDFKVFGLTIDCKCRSMNFTSIERYFKFLNSSKIWCGSGKLKADRYILMFNNMEEKLCDIVGWIPGNELQQYKEKNGVYSPYISRFKDISLLFS